MLYLTMMLWAAEKFAFVMCLFLCEYIFVMESMLRLSVRGITARSCIGHTCVQRRGSCLGRRGTVS